MKTKTIYEISGGIMATVLDPKSVQEIVARHLYDSGMRVPLAEPVLSSLRQWLTSNPRPFETKSFDAGRLSFSITCKEKTQERPSTVQ